MLADSGNMRVESPAASRAAFAIIGDCWVLDGDKEFASYLEPFPGRLLSKGSKIGVRIGREQGCAG